MDRNGIVRNIIGEDDDYEENEEKMNKLYKEKQNKRKKYCGI